MAHLSFWAFLHCTHFDAEHKFWTVHARVLKFHVWISHEKIADIFFSYQDYTPFLSYGPLKKYGVELYLLHCLKYCQQNILKLLKLEPWNLRDR